mgnify:CR=1 FL=1
MKVNGYKNLTIATIFAVFLLQAIWLYNSFGVAVNKLTADVNAFFIQCMMKKIALVRNGLGYDGSIYEVSSKAYNFNFNNSLK